MKSLLHAGQLSQLGSSDKQNFKICHSQFAVILQITLQKVLNVKQDQSCTTRTEYVMGS